MRGGFHSIRMVLATIVWFIGKVSGLSEIARLSRKWVLRRKFRNLARAQAFCSFCGVQLLKMTCGDVLYHNSPPSCTDCRDMIREVKSYEKGRKGA